MTTIDPAGVKLSTQPALRWERVPYKRRGWFADCDDPRGRWLVVPSRDTRGQWALSFNGELRKRSRDPEELKKMAQAAIPWMRIESL